MLYKKITKVAKKLQQNNPETVTNENDKEIPKERSVFPKERQNIIDNLIFNVQYNNGISKHNKLVKQYTK